MWWLLILIIVAAGAFYFGYIPHTKPYFERLMKTYYMSLLATRSCDEIEYIMATYAAIPEFVDYMQREEIMLRRQYPLDILQQHVNQYSCTDRQGNPIVLE